MQVIETSSEGLRYDFKVTVAAGDIKEKLDTRLAEVGRQARVPGFRPGKVPMAILKRRFASSVMGEILEFAVRDSTSKLLEDRGLRPAMQPKVEISAFDDGADLEYALTVEVMPDFEPMDVATLELERPKAQVRDEDVRQGLEQLAARRHDSEPITEDRAVAEGDIAVIDFTGRVDGEVFEGGTGEDVHVEIGAERFLPDFEAQIVGHRAGEEFTVTVTFPEDYPTEALAGNSAVFDVTLTELRRPKPTPVDDSLAEAMGFDDLGALKDVVRERLEREWASIGRAKMKRQLLDKLAEAHDFPVPPTMLEEEFKAIWEQVVKAKEEGELDPDDAKLGEDELEAQYRAIALRRVRLGLLLSVIGERAEIEVTPEELNRAVMAQARRYPGEEEKIVDFYRKNPRAIMSLRAPIFEDKVVDYIAEMAKVEEREVSRDELFATEDEADAATGR